MRQWRQRRDQSSIHQLWRAQIDAERSFEAALYAVANVPAADMSELLSKAALSVVYDAVPLSRNNPAPIGRTVAFSLIKLSGATGQVVAS